MGGMGVLKTAMPLAETLIAPKRMYLLILKYLTFPKFFSKTLVIILGA